MKTLFQYLNPRNLVGLFTFYAFDSDNFQPIGGQGRKGKAPQMFAYRTTDSHATVDTAGYFNDVYSLLGFGDIIYVVVVGGTADTPTSVTTYGPHIVINYASNVVDVTNVTVGTVTDSD